MIKLLLSFLFFCITAGCSTSQSELVGIHSHDEAKKATDSLFLDASPDSVWRSLDVTGMPKEKIEKSRIYWAQGWAKATLRKHHQWTKIMSPSEYRSLITETRKDQTAELRDRPIQWATEPDHVIVYYFESRQEKTSASAYFSLGLFKRGELWYLSPEK